MYFYIRNAYVVSYYCVSEQSVIFAFTEDFFRALGSNSNIYKLRHYSLATYDHARIINKPDNPRKDNREHTVHPEQFISYSNLKHC